MIRTKRVYDAYYWLVSIIVYFVLAIVFSIIIIRFILQDQKNVYLGLVAEALMLLLGCYVVKTTVGLFREYQFAPSEITEYSVFRKKRTFAWEDYPHAYIVWMGPLFRLPHSCNHFFLLTKSPLPARIKRERDKDPAHYYKNPKEYILFGYSEELEQQIRELRPDVKLIRRDLNQH